MESRAPLVSVLVPAWNAAWWLGDALRSALAQTLVDIEVILVDDASRDATFAIAQQLAARDRRLRLFRRATNGGPALARNEALARARGTWIAVLDADDWMAAERLAQLVAVAEQEGAVWIADDQWIELEPPSGRPARLLWREPEPVAVLDAVRFLDRDPPEAIGYGTLKPLIRRSFLEQHELYWRPEAVRAEDFIFTLECLLHGAPALLLNQPLYFYRLRAGSQVTGLDPLATLARVAAAQELAERLCAPFPDPALKAALARRRARIEAASAYRALLAALRGGRPAAAAAMLARRPALAPALAAGALEALRRRLIPARPPTLAERQWFLASLDRIAARGAG